MHIKKHTHSFDVLIAAVVLLILLSLRLLYPSSATVEGVIGHGYDILLVCLMVIILRDRHTDVTAVMKHNARLMDENEKRRRDYETLYAEYCAMREKYVETQRELVEVTGQCVALRCKLHKTRRKYTALGFRLPGNYRKVRVGGNEFVTRVARLQFINGMWSSWVENPFPGDMILEDELEEHIKLRLKDGDAPNENHVRAIN